MVHFDGHHRSRVAACLLLIPALTRAQSSACNIINGRQADCANLGLTSIPTDVPDGVILIDLSGNALTELQAGSLDRFTSLIHLDLSGNSISGVAPGTFAAQMIRTNNAATLLPLTVLTMTGNPSVCSISGDRPNRAVYCNCAPAFEVSPLTQFGREACISGPTPPSLPPSAAPTSLAPTSPTAAPTSAAPTTAPTFGLSFEVVGGRGCCANSALEFYTFVRYDNVSSVECEALCVAEPACRGIEVPWSVNPSVQGQCFLDVDSGSTPVNSSFAATGVGSPGTVTGVVSHGMLGTHCSRNLFQCHRICRAGSTSLAQTGCDGPSTTPAPVTPPVPLTDRLQLTLAVSPGSLNTSYWVDQRPPFGSATGSPPFESAIAAVVCSERGAVFSTTAIRSSCLQNLRVTVTSVTSPQILSSTTTITFYAVVNATIQAASVISAINAYPSADLRTIFQYGVEGIVPQQVVGTTTVASSSTRSGGKEVSFITFALVTVATVVVLLILLMVIIFAVMRLRKMRALVATLRSNTGYTKLKTEREEYPYGPPRAVAQFYGQNGGGAAVRPPASRPSKKPPLNGQTRANGGHSSVSQPAARLALGTPLASLQRPWEQSDGTSPADRASTAVLAPKETSDSHGRAPMVMNQAFVANPVAAAVTHISEEVPAVAPTVLAAPARHIPAAPAASESVPASVASADWESQLRAEMDAAAADLRRTATTAQKTAHAAPPALSRTSANSRMTSVRLAFDDKDDGADMAAQAYELSMPHGVETARW